MKWILLAATAVGVCYWWCKTPPPPPDPFQELKEKLLPALIQGLKREYLDAKMLKNIVKLGDLNCLRKALEVGDESTRTELLSIYRERGTPEQVTLCVSYLRSNQ